MSCLQLYKKYAQSMHHEVNNHNSRVFELRILAVVFQFQQHAMPGRFSMT